MRGFVCAITGGKGGVGKTTTAVNVGAAMQERGHDVVIVDADLGMANLGAMLDVDNERTLHEVLAEEATVGDALTDVAGGTTAITGDRRLEAFADADPADLRRVIKTLRNAYDLVLVDTGAGLSRDVAVPLRLADGVVLVTTPDDISVSDTRKTEQLADRIDSRVIGVLLNRVMRRTDVSAINEHFTADVVAAVPDDIEATATEPLVVEAPESAPADAFARFAETLDLLVFDSDIDAEDIIVKVDDAWFSGRDDVHSDTGTDDIEATSADDANDDDSVDEGDSDSTVSYSMGWR